MPLPKGNEIIEVHLGKESLLLFISSSLYFFLVFQITHSA